MRKILYLALLISLPSLGDDGSTIAAISNNVDRVVQQFNTTSNRVMLAVSNSTEDTSTVEGLLSEISSQLSTLEANTKYGSRSVARACVEMKDAILRIKSTNLPQLYAALAPLSSISNDIESIARDVSFLQMTVEDVYTWIVYIYDEIQRVADLQNAMNSAFGAFTTNVLDKLEISPTKVYNLFTNAPIVVSFSGGDGGSEYLRTRVEGGTLDTITTIDDFPLTRRQMFYEWQWNTTALGMGEWDNDLLGASREQWDIGGEELENVIADGIWWQQKNAYALLEGQKRILLALGGTGPGRDDLENEVNTTWNEGWNDYISKESQLQEAIDTNWQTLYGWYRTRQGEVISVFQSPQVKIQNAEYFKLYVHGFQILGSQFETIDFTPSEGFMASSGLNDIFAIIRRIMTWVWMVSGLLFVVLSFRLAVKCCAFAWQRIEFIFSNVPS